MECQPIPRADRIIHSKGRQNHTIVALQYILDSEEKRMRLERPSGIVELRQQLRKELKPHEQYSTGYEIPPVSAGLRPEVRCKPSQPEVEQKPIIHLLQAGHTSSGVPATTVPRNPWPANPDVLIATPTNIPQRNSSSFLICTDEIPSLELWSYGRECGNEGIPTRLMLTYDSMSIQKNRLTLPHEFSVNFLKSPF